MLFALVLAASSPTPPLQDTFVETRRTLPTGMVTTPTSLQALRQQLEEAAGQCDRPTPKVAVWLPTAVDPDEE